MAPAGPQGTEHELGYINTQGEYANALKEVATLWREKPTTSVGELNEHQRSGLVPPLSIRPAVSRQKGLALYI
jgi:hypothetical protein